MHNYNYDIGVKKFKIVSFVNLKTHGHDIYILIRIWRREVINYFIKRKPIERI